MMMILMVVVVILMIMDNTNNVTNLFFSISFSVSLIIFNIFGYNESNIANNGFIIIPIIISCFFRLLLLSIGSKKNSIPNYGTRKKDDKFDFGIIAQVEIGSRLKPKPKSHAIIMNRTGSMTD